ncbi:hypothetical protein [Candidatus Avelusimicrobium fimicolum]|uniref:hypothetical protein n=1 Tax=Candidatus Avelusimicrobium fimicolum TaxID=3416216 RepID=UPI003D10C562
MNTALILAAFLFGAIVVVWVVARKAARAEKELENAKKQLKEQQTASNILGKFINLSSAELLDRVRGKREKALKRRLRDTDRLDR